MHRPAVLIFSVSDAHLVTALARIQLEERERAEEELSVVRGMVNGSDLGRLRLLECATVMCNSVAREG
ncbi:MAG: hypothetical protein WDW36_004753 [Sanguina aurantia]